MIIKLKNLAIGKNSTLNWNRDYRKSTVMKLFIHGLYHLRSSQIPSTAELKQQEKVQSLVQRTAEYMNDK